MKKIIKNRFLVGLASVGLGLLILLFVSPYVGTKLNEQKEVYQAKKDIDKGEIIKKEDIEKVKKGSLNLPNNLVLKEEEIVGKYATAKIFSNDNITENKLTEISLEHDYLYNLPEGKMAISVSLESLARGLSGKLEKNDIVRIYSVNESVQSLESLQYVLVLAATNGEGTDKENVEKSEKKDTIPKTVTLLVTDKQAKDLAYMEEKEKIHVALVFRGDKAVRDEFLAKQEEILEKILASGQEESGEKPLENKEEK